MTDIETDIDMPAIRRGRKSKWPFEKCTEVGMSFFVANRTTMEMGSQVAYWNKKLHPWRFCGSSHDENGKRWTMENKVGMRIFRVE